MHFLCHKNQSLSKVHATTDTDRIFRGPFGKVSNIVVRLICKRCPTITVFGVNFLTICIFEQFLNKLKMCPDFGASTDLQNSVLFFDESKYSFFPKMSKAK